MNRRKILMILLAATLLGTAFAAAPPDRMNYQGVLRDSADSPVSATYNMVFRLHDAETLGNELLVDQHLISNGQGVTIDNGLFNTEIGGGAVFDGTGPGFFNTLTDVFGAYSDLWLDIEINGELLSPRVPIMAAGHALNAGHADTADTANSANNANTVGGYSSASLLNTSGSNQTKSGSLTVSGLLTAGGNLDVQGPRIDLGSGMWLLSDTFSTILQAGDEAGDDLYLQAGNGPGSGRIVVNGNSQMRFESGDGSYTFNNTAAVELAALDSSGNLQIDGSLNFGNNLTSPAGPNIVATADTLNLSAGLNDSDDIRLVAGNDASDGEIAIFGDGALNLRAGNGQFGFVDGATGVQMALLAGNGNLQIDGSLTVDGGDINHSGDMEIGGQLDVLGNRIDYGNGSFFNGSPNALIVQAGDAGTDDLYLQAGIGTNNGRIAILGGGEMTLNSGNGNFSFEDALGNQKADLSSSGSLTINSSLKSFAGPEMLMTSNLLRLQAGTEATDLLYLAAGHDLTNTRIQMTGNGGTSFYSESGTYRFFNSGTNQERAYLGPLGDFRIEGDMTVNGNNLILGAGGELAGSSFSTTLYGGIDTADDLILYANKASLYNGGMQIIGGQNVNFFAGSGNFYFYNGSTNTAILDSLGNLDLDGRLDLDGGDIYMVETGVDQTQDIHFREDNLISGERFEWDNINDRFEVSDDFHVYGSLTATTKNFVQNHPYRDDLEIVYTSLEGDEATTFTRGFGRLENGEARIALGETFAYVSNPDLGLSAHLTPRGEWADLYVVELTTEELVVRSAPGDPDVQFDFMVFGLRIGLEDFPVMRPKRSESFLPPEASFDEDRGFDPELKKASALARYRRMATDVSGFAELDLSRAQALKQAIGQRDNQADYPVGSDRSVAAIMMDELDMETDPDTDIHQIGEQHVPGTGDAISTTDSPTDSPVTTATQTGLQRDGNGNVYADSFRPAASEVATMLPAGEALTAGDVVTIDPVTGSMALSRLNGDRAVFGVVAAAPGVVLGSQQPGDTMDETELEDVPVAMSGIVLCNVDASFGAIRPGDLLVTSETPGHAMRSDDPAAGSVLGKAIQALDVGTGTIRVLVTLR